MNIQSTIFSRAKMKSFKKQSLFFTILGIVVIILAFSILDTSIRGLNGSKTFIVILLVFGGLVVSAFGIRGLYIAPKIESYLNLTGRESCTGREYEEWAANYVPVNHNTQTTNYGNRPNGTASPQNGSNRSTADPQPKYRILHCPQCAAQLRLPDNGKKLNVTCPKCTNKFII